MPSSPFVAMIIPLGGSGGGDAHPEHPIYYPPAQPPYPAHPIAGGPWPSHPIYGPQPPQPGQPPLGIWGPPDMPPGFWGGGMGPGVKPQPHPEHPIYIPAPPTDPVSPPLVIWGGPYFPPEPTHPIELPPEVAPPETPDGRPIDWKVAWTPTTGWIVVGIPSGEHPAPSK